MFHCDTCHGQFMHTLECTSQAAKTLRDRLNGTPCVFHKKQYPEHDWWYGPVCRRCGTVKPDGVPGGATPD